jgi:UPF0716 protein FxsA|tara:strand:+ start:4463 stop:4975 length:513 start_codon:yes stop_codon:yes gene_type:complete
MFWLLLFFLMPIIEMYLLFTVAGYIDAWPTVALVMLTAVIGVSLLKRQGLATLTRGLGRMNSGQVPGQEIAEGILLGIAGALLITPGFVTDAVGFLLLFPPSRIAIAGAILRNATLQTNMTANTRANAFFYGPDVGVPPPGQGASPIKPTADASKPGATLEGEYLRKDGR